MFLKIFIEFIVKVVLVIVGVFGEFVLSKVWILINKDGEFEVENLNNYSYIVMYCFFGLFGVVDFMMWYNLMFLLLKCDYLIFFVCFWVEGFLFYFYFYGYLGISVCLYMIFYIIIFIIVVVFLVDVFLMW